MKRTRFVTATAAILLFGASHNSSALDPVSTIAEGCKAELAAHCSGVTPGEGRVLACLYAFQDKLSGRCEYSLYDAAAQLEHAVGALNYLAGECGADFKQYCAQIQPGEGRIAQCLKTNEAKLSARCGQAIKDTGLEVGPAQ